MYSTRLFKSKKCQKQIDISVLFRFFTAAHIGLLTRSKHKKDYNGLFSDKYHNNYQRNNRKI